MTNTEGTLFEAFLAGLVACAATSLGGSFALVKMLTGRTMAKGTAIGGGIMLAASLFSLILPGFNEGKKVFGNNFASAVISSTGILLGVFLIVALGKLSVDKPGEKNAWVSIWAITIHNFPEGLAIGVAYGGPAPDARKLAAAISLQDIPEGAVVAVLLMSLMSAKKIRWKRFLAIIGAFLSGIAEPAAAIVGRASVDLSQSALPWGMAVAAGAMLFVVIHSMIPNAKEGLGDYQSTILYALLGFLLMAALDVFLPVIFSY